MSEYSPDPCQVTPAPRAALPVAGVPVVGVSVVSVMGLILHRGPSRLLTARLADVCGRCPGQVREGVTGTRAAGAAGLGADAVRNKFPARLRSPPINKSVH